MIAGAGMSAAKPGAAGAQGLHTIAVGGGGRLASPDVDIESPAAGASSSTAGSVVPGDSASPSAAGSWKAAKGAGVSSGGVSPGADTCSNDDVSREPDVTPGLASSSAAVAAPSPSVGPPRRPRASARRRPSALRRGVGGRDGLRKRRPGVLLRGRRRRIVARRRVGL